MSSQQVGERLWRWGSWVASSSEFAAAGGEVAFLQFNVCGSACNEGKVEPLVAVLRDIVVEVDPDVVLLNELCLAQAEQLWERLEGFAASAAFAATAGVSRCPGEPGSRWFGNALFSRRSGIGEPEVAALPNLPTALEKRSVLTMRTPLAGVPAAVSVTHLVPGRSRELNARQVAQLFAMQSAVANSGEPAVFAGDLNATPRQVSRVSDAGGFVDIDAGAAPTLKARKIDYIMLDRRYFTPVQATARRITRLSDHRCLYGRAAVRSQQGERL